MSGNLRRRGNKQRGTTRHPSVLFQPFEPPPEREVIVAKLVYAPLVCILAKRLS
jgi:hypothetical protein